MGGDYKIEVFGRGGHYFMSKDSWAKKADAFDAARDRILDGTYAGCEVYVVNRTTGWRSSKVEPRDRSADR